MEPVYLYNPNFIELDDAYRSLPKLGNLLLKTSNCGQTIHELEKIGFVAIEVLSHDSEDTFWSIRAFKGKHGPCHFNGRKARYTGAALVALDDDNHLIFRNRFRVVCDKTFGIFSLPPYNNRIDCQKYSPEQINSNHKEESGDFESDQSLLFDQLKSQKPILEGRMALFYSGPFKMLILQDGTLVRRGKFNSIPLSQSDELIRKDGLWNLKGEQKETLSFFQSEYETHGSACLLGDFKFEAIDQPDYETDFSKLSLVSHTFKTRLLKAIDDQKKYFVLIGNDAQDQLGCCPSEEVTEANRLVKQGVLSSLAEPVQGDSCPVTVYAFKDEISVTDQVLSSTVNIHFREQVRVHLKKSTQSNRKMILKWVLLAFITLSLVLATRKCYKAQLGPSENISLQKQLNPLNKNQIQLILFHNKKRCFQCLQIEKYTREVLNEFFYNELTNEGIQFKTLTIDDADNISIIDHFGIFAATLVLMDLNKNERASSKVLMEVTALYRDENAFKAKLKIEIEQLLNQRHE